VVDSTQSTCKRRPTFHTTFHLQTGFEETHGIMRAMLGDSELQQDFLVDDVVKGFFQTENKVLSLKNISHQMLFSNSAVDDVIQSPDRIKRHWQVIVYFGI
jgi:hypothetical protein